MIYNIISQIIKIFPALGISLSIGLALLYKFQNKILYIPEMGAIKKSPK